MMAVAELHVAPSAAKSSLEIAEYTKRDLEALLRDESFWMQPRLPITKRRVVSQVANPRADDNDTLLLTAHFKGQLVACLGVLPDQVKDPSQGRVKFGWLTAWWADKESEQRLAAMKLLFMAMKRYANRLAASSPASAAASAYLNTGQFEEHGRCDRTYFIISMSPSTGLPGRVVRSVAGVKNRWLYGRSAVRRELRVHIPDVFDAQMESFIDHQAQEDPFGRDSLYWNWALRFPWMSSTDEDRVMQEKYTFSVFAGDFRQIPMFVSRHGRIIAFLVMTLRDHRLTLKHAYYDPADVTDVTAAVRSAVAEINPWLFVCGDAGIDARLRRGFPFYLARKARHSAIYATKTLPRLPWSRPQPGSGDSLFT
jgi:hypothetical protein